jgi:peptidoglycan/LPS O-acetylase OafA/YrhL
MSHDHSQHSSPTPAFWGSRYFFGLLILGAIGLFLLMSEHRAHVLGALPLLILLACPLMHVFMHGSHGGHGHAREPGGSDDQVGRKDGGAS